MGIRVKSTNPDRQGQSPAYAGNLGQGSMAAVPTANSERDLPNDVTTLSHGDRADIRSLTQKQQETADSISILQTASQGLEESHDRLIKLKELASRIERSQTDHKSIETYRGILEELDRIADEVTYKGHPLFLRQTKGSESTGWNTIEDNAFRAVARELMQLDPHAQSLGIKGAFLDVANMEAIDSALVKIRNFRSHLDVTQQSLSSSLDTIRDQLHHRLHWDERESPETENNPSTNPTSAICEHATSSLQIHGQIIPQVALLLIP